MTREQAKELLPIIQAFAEGKTIQLKKGDNWVDLHEPNFVGCNEMYYRIKPEEDMRKSFEEGKQLQVKTSDGCVDVCTRSETSSSLIEWDKHEFRIKPTEKQYRPFEDTAELMLYYSKHFHVEYPPFYEPLIWVKHKTSDSRYLITSYDELSVNVDDIWLDMKDLFEKYVFLDNSIIGKVVE